MSAITEVSLSASTDGKAIKVAATATPGTLLHTAHATAQDEIWLYAMNSDSVARLLTIEFGGVSDPDNLVEITLPPAGAPPTLVVPGWKLTNSAATRAFAAAANVVTVIGHVNRIT